MAEGNVVPLRPPGAARDRAALRVRGRKAQPMIALYDRDCRLAAWLQPDRHIFDARLNWVAFVHGGHAYAVAGHAWLGPVTGATCLDRSGRPVLWHVPPNGTLPPRTPLGPVVPLPPGQPLPPPLPLRPRAPLTPIGGWSPLSVGQWLGLEPVVVERVVDAEPGEAHQSLPSDKPIVEEQE